MSEIVHYIGKLTPVTTVVDIENTARIMLMVMGFKPNEADGTFIEQLEDAAYGNIIVLNGTIYEVSKTKKDPYDDIFKATINPDDTIDFEVKYYNGGCSFPEAINTAMRR